MAVPTNVKRRYDWRGCGIALAAGFAAAIPAGLTVQWLTGSTMLLNAVIVAVGMSVSHWTYARVARPGSRPRRLPATPPAGPESTAPAARRTASATVATPPCDWMMSRGPW